METATTAEAAVARAIFTANTDAVAAQPRRVVVAIAMPFADMLHPATFRSVMRLDKSKCDGVHLLDVRDHPIEMARNEIVGRMFTIPEITHVLWVDDDMVFEPDALSRLLAHDLPIVGGLCHNRRHPYMPILLHKQALTEKQHRYIYQYEYPEGLVKVDATGAAFILVKREVYEAIEHHPDFQQPGLGPYSNMGNGEDTALCERAKVCGFDTYVDTTVKVGHVAEVVVDETFARKNRMCEVSPWNPATKPPEGEPVATIVIPTFNQKPAWLRQAVESAVMQSVPCEVIVVDNGSDACPWCGTEWPAGHSAQAHGEGPLCGNSACKGPPLYAHLKEIRRSENGGSPWPALNAGIHAMTTPWFTWLSSDDLFHHRKVEKQMRYMQVLGADACYHGYEMKGKDGTGNLMPVVLWRDMQEQQRVLANACVVNGLTAMLSKRVFEEVGTFSESPDFQIVADWEFWNRVARRFFWHPMQDSLATRRDFDNATERYANDEKKRMQWKAEDARVRAMYASNTGG